MNQIHVHISGLKRPFTISSIKELLSRYGNVQDFWLNSIRSHCIVGYNTMDNAQKCVEDIDGLKWPEVIGQPLSVNILDESILKVEDLKIQLDRDSIVHTSSREKSKKENDDPITSCQETFSSFPEEKKPSRNLEELFIKTKSQPHLYYKLAIEDY